MLRKILFLSLLAVSTSSFNLKADDSDPITAGLIWATASVGGGMIGATVIMSNDRIREDRNANDNTQTNTRDQYDTTRTNTQQRR